MNKVLFLFGCALAAAPVLTATTIPVGFVSWDVTVPGSSGQFDVANETGPNSSGDATAPVTTPISFTDLNLQITFTDGSTEKFGAGDFTLNMFDGLSWQSPAIQVGGSNPSPQSATLTGSFATTSVTLFDATQVLVDPDFAAAILSQGTALSDGDLAIINASASASAITPEPGSLPLFIAGLLVLLLSALNLYNRRRRIACSR